MTNIQKLSTIIKGDIDTSEATLTTFSRDASLFVVKPEIVVSPKDADDISALVKFVNEELDSVTNDFSNANSTGLKSGRISITARSAGTDMSGGPLNTSIILNMTRYMEGNIEIVGNTVSVLPGTLYRVLDKKTKGHNLELPSYTASRELCTVGGMVANNSGGEKHLKYGKTDKYVESLEVVLSDGNQYTLKAWSGDELRSVLSGTTFLSECARKVSELVQKNTSTISSGKPSVRKNSSGYALWDIGDGVNSLNLARLFTGSQGTLGIITNITFSLIQPKPYAAMTVIFANSIDDIGMLVDTVLHHNPDSFESYDDHTLNLAVKYFPEFASKLGTNIFGVGLSFLPELYMAITGGIPKLILLVEFRAETQAEATENAIKLQKNLAKEFPQYSTRVARDEAAAKKYWLIRRESFNLLRSKIRGKRTAPFIDDFVVDPASLSQFLPELSEILSQYDLTYTIAGHIGDGNFHIIPLVDPLQAGVGKMIDVLSHQVYDLVVKYHGSISGEHNDGLIRTPYLEKMFGSDMVKLFKDIKDIFDPRNVFNPGKKIGTTFADALTKMDVTP
jgi:FAD/FMN-containing dehydrogenase